MRLRAPWVKLIAFAIPLVVAWVPLVHSLAAVTAPRSYVMGWRIVPDCTPPPRTAWDPRWHCDPALAADKVREAVAYLWHSPTARRLITRLVASRARIRIVVYHDMDDGASHNGDGSDTVWWDPYVGHVVANGARQSPALALVYELVHALHDTGNWHESEYVASLRDRAFDNREELRTIRYGETPIARELDEGTRSDHGDGRGFYITDDPVVH